ncbi:MAG: hypothetical protein ACHQYQ_01280 [Bacteriovoracales bacterium]
MNDKIKEILCSIEALESEGSDSLEAGSELGRLYSKMKEFGFIWNTRIKEWVYDDTTDPEEEDTDEIPEKL